MADGPETARRIEVLPPTQPRRGRRGRWIGMGLGGLLLVALATVGVLVAREEAKCESCANTIGCMGCAMHLYADDNDGAFPESLNLLYTQNYADNPRIFSCPARPSSYADFKTGRVSERSSSYAQVPWLTRKMPGKFILAFEKDQANHQRVWKQGGRNVLFINLDVEYWPASREPEFQRRLALQAEAVAKWRASGKPAGNIGEFIKPELRELMGK